MANREDSRNNSQEFSPQVCLGPCVLKILLQQLQLWERRNCGLSKKVVTSTAALHIAHVSQRLGWNLGNCYYRFPQRKVVLSANSISH